MQLTFIRQDSDVEEMQEEVSPDLKLGEIRQAVKTKLGFPEHQPCSLILERTGEKLGDSLTLKEAGVDDNDKLILSPLNTVNTYQESEKTNDVSSTSEEKESPSSFNFKAFPALMAGGMVLISVVGGLLHLQTLQQQAIINKQLEQERIQKQETERQLEQEKVQQAIVNQQLEQEKTEREEIERQLEQEKVQQTIVNQQLEQEKAKREEVERQLEQEKVQQTIVNQQLEQEKAKREEVKRQRKETQYQAVVFNPPSNVRVAPTSSTNNVLCSVRSRSIINIYEPTGKWFKTNVCGQIGYIHQSQIKTNLNFNFYSQEPVNISRVGVAMVIDPPSNIRYTPNGKIICSVNDNRHINIYNLVEEWYKTDFCGSVGYIHKSQVDF